MGAGKLDRRITLQTATNTNLTPAGAPVMVWADMITVHAQLIQRSTAEYIRAQGAQDEDAVAFRIRHRQGVTTSCRVLFEGRPYDIREIAPVGRRVWLDLRCIEITGEMNG